MPRQLIKRFMPSHETVRNHKHLKVFGSLLHDPNLWHLNRRSAAGAFAVGLFMAFVPVPFQMLLAAGAAILFRVNLPLSVALVWLTNPVTMPPIFYFAFLVGDSILGSPRAGVDINLGNGDLLKNLGGLWEPFLLGCFVCGLVAATVGYFGIRALWRWQLVQQLKKRREKRRAAAAPAVRTSDHPRPGTPSAG